MKTKKITFLLFICILCFSITSYSQVKKEFEIRYDTIIKGKFTTIGNNTLSKDRIEPFNEKDDLDSTNGSIDMQNVDIDDDPTTFNSSSANFINPNVDCFSIKKVLLYWSATDVEKGWKNGSPNEIENQPDWEYNDVKLMLPGENTYTTLTADEVIYRGRNESNHFSNDPYTCVKDITSLVKKANTSYGTYQVANVESATGVMKDHLASGTGASGGWQIVFVYEYLNATAKRITLFDGYSQLIVKEGVETKTRFDIEGFLTVPNGDVNAEILFGSIEGDQPFTGDQLTIRKLDTDEFVPLGLDLIRSKDNFFNSSITIGDNVFLDREPASENTLGFDAGVFKLDNPDNSIIGQNQTKTTLELTTKADSYGLYLFGFSIEVYQPDLAPILLSSDAGDPKSPIEIIPGNDLTPINFSLKFKNNGNDNAQNVKLSTILPNQSEFIPPTPLPTGITFNVNSTTKVLDILVDNSLMKSNGEEITINYGLGIKDNCHFLIEDCDNLNFNAQFTATYGGEKSDGKQTTTSSNEVGNCLVGNNKPLTFVVKPQAPYWITKDLSQTLSCDETTKIEDALKASPKASCDFDLEKISTGFIPDNKNCASNGKYINKWTFTQQCDFIKKIDTFTQVVTIYDNKKPTLDDCSGKLNDLQLQCGTTKDFNIQAQDWHNENLKTLLGCAKDNCVSITADNISSDFKFNTTGIPCVINETVTYTINDNCGNSLTKQLKIAYKDIDGPQINLCTMSFDETIECSGGKFDDIFNTWNAKNITTLEQCAKDLCDLNSKPQINTKKTKYELRCGNTGIAIMEYVAIDRCGNRSQPKTATLIVKDTQKPFLFKGVIKNTVVTCGNMPPKPVVQFRDKCSLDSVKVVYTEIKPDVTQDEDFIIKRTWTVTDLCLNTETFTQIVKVQVSRFLFNYDDQHCFDDGKIDLNAYLPRTSNTYKNWTYVDGPLKDVDLKDGIFDPSKIDIDSLGLFKFKHTEPFGFCFRDTYADLDITDNCIVYPCGPENFTFSKTITPNGDNFNQFFTVIGSRECEFKINLKIFNRWGSIIYENKNYQNNWDANTIKSSIGNNGKVPNGTYFYVVELIDSGFDLFTGPIYIGTK